jgi:hypothetical protein
LSFIAVCIRGYGSERKIECSTSSDRTYPKCQEVIISSLLKVKNNSDLEAKTSAKTSVSVSFPDDHFCDVVGKTEQKISSLSDAVEKFVPQIPE